MTSRNFKQSMVNQDQEIIFEVVKVSGSWVFPAASSIVEATRGKNMYLRLTDDGRSDIFRLDSVKEGENAGETVFGFVGNGGMDLVELTATTDGTGATTGSWDYEPGEGPAGEAIGNLGKPLIPIGTATVSYLNGTIEGLEPGWMYTLTDSGTLTAGSVEVEAGDEVAWGANNEWFKVGGESSKVAVLKFADTAYPLIADMNAELLNGKDIVLIRTSYPSRYDVFYLTYRNSGSGHIRMTFTGTGEILDVEDDVWTVTKQALNGVRNGGSVAQSGGYASVENNSLTTITGVDVAALEVSVSFGNGSTEVPNFALEIDPTVDCTLTLKRYIGSSPLTLTPSVAGGNVMTAGKHYQVTCVGSYWTLAEFAMPSP